jgi:hypothetical protein
MVKLGSPSMARVVRRLDEKDLRRRLGEGAASDHCDQKQRSASPVLPPGQTAPGRLTGPARRVPHSKIDLLVQSDKELWAGRQWAAGQLH